MSQRNPMNERYLDENRGGKTRKSAASAKPSAARAATVHTPAPKTKKQKKKEAAERERKQQERYAMETPSNKRVEDLPEYKRLRRIWWVCLIISIALIALAFLSSQYEPLSPFYVPFIIGGYIMVIVAFYIELGKMRKLRNNYRETVLQGKSKEARAAQKKARAEAREQQREAAAKKANAEEEKAEGGLGARLMKSLPFGKKDADTSSEEPTADSSSDKGNAASK